MAATNETIRYFYNEAKNRILVSSSVAGANTSISIMNAQLTSSKNTIFDPNFNAKISTVGSPITYQVQNGAADTTQITVESDQELWVYKGYSPGVTDGNFYKYNPYLHRPYKAYIVTKTGSGTPASPWLPSGSNLNFFSNTMPGGDITNAFGEKTLAAVGNFGQPVNGVTLITTASVSGSVEVFAGGDSSTSNFVAGNTGRTIRPFIFTNYPQMANNFTPPAMGAEFSFYQEAFPGGAKVTQSISNLYKFNTTTTTGNPLTDRLAFNNATVASSTTCSINNANTAALILLGMSASIAQGKKASIRLIITGSNGNTVTIEPDTFEFVPSPGYWSLTYNTISVSSDPPFTNLMDLDVTVSGSRLIQNAVQTQHFNENQAAQTYQVDLTNGIYSYTSSLFDAGSPSAPISGSTQFGLFAELDNYAQYRAKNFNGNPNDPVRIFFTGSFGESLFFDLPVNEQAIYRAKVGSISYGTPTGSFAQFENIVINPSVPGQQVEDVFATRWENAFISFSSSLSSSLDGLYVFNQLPQNDVQVTASMLLNAWTGEAISGANYGEFGYGAGNYGQAGTTPGTTWPTASILIFTGSVQFPNVPPLITATPFTTSMFTNENIHTGSLPITMSFLIPSQSINFKDCLSVALKVESGSFNSASVENSLVVSQYELEFNTPTQSLQGDGRVPTFIDNAFSGSDGFSNAPDCQPLLNNINADRINPQIQNVDYATDIYYPSNWDSIVSGSATKSTVPESYYTLLRQINPRYDGSRTQADAVNSTVGLRNGFGAVPVIDYERAYFAYSDRIFDLYPVINNKTLFNIKYLINDGGDANQPQLSPYTAFDVEGTWTEGGLARIGVNTVSGSTKFNELNNFQIVSKVAKEPVPVLWSQTSAGTFTTAIPLSGNPDEVSNFNAQFLNYNTTAFGSNFNVNNNNRKLVTGSLTGEIDYTSSTAPWTATSSSRFGLSGSDGINYVNPTVFLTASTAFPGLSGSFGARGDAFLSTDPFISPSITPPLTVRQLLSSVYTYEIKVEIPSTPPQRFRYDSGGTFDSSDYSDDSGNWRNVIGTIKIYLQYNLNTTPTEDASGWSTVRILEVAEPTITYFYPQGQSLTLNLRNVVGSNSCRFVNQGSSGGYFLLEINEKKLTAAVENAGLQPTEATYATFNFHFRNDPTAHQIRANRRYRYYYEANYINEPVDADRNYFNPTNRPQRQGGAAIFPPVEGPFVDVAFTSDQSSGTAVDNAINAPYWYFSQSNNIGPLPYSWTGSTAMGTVADGNIMLNNSNIANVTQMKISSLDTEFNNSYTNNNFVSASLGSNLPNTVTITNGSDETEIATFTVNTWTATTSTSTLGLTFVSTSSNFKNWSGNETGTIYSSSVKFAKGAAEPQDQFDFIFLSSSNANTAYANGYYQGFTPYTASVNPIFPGGFEPADTAFPQYGIQWEVFPGDEIRFENLESKVYTIQRVFPPSETENNQLKLQLINGIPNGVNKDFFLLRRYRYSPNSLVIDKLFPYGSLPVKKEFIPSNNTVTTYGGGNFSTATGSTSVAETSGSIVEVYSPLLQSDNVPNGFVFPEFPTAEIELDPDKILVDLRDKKLIE